MGAPAVGTVVDGYRFKGGNHRDRNNWEQVSPVDVSGQWGSGAQQLPNGDVVRYGPRGGLTVLQQGGSEDGVGKLTEAQGKAMLYGGMMAGAERDYQAARERGYNPGDFRNQIADWADAIPWDGGRIPRLIRDDISDAGRQAELRWAEGNLRQLTGAAATNPEISRVAAINFDRAGDDLAAQRYRTRAETYQGTRFAAGAGASQLPDYPTGGVYAAPDDPRPGDVRVSSQPLAPDDTPESLRAQGYVYDPERDTWSRSRQEVVTPQSAVAERNSANPLLRRIDGLVRGAADAATFGFADEIAAGGDALIGRGRGRNFNERYTSNLAIQRALDQADASKIPVMRFGGQAAGAVAGPGAAGGRLIARAQSLGGRALRGAAVGIPTGGMYGAGSGEGGPMSRVASAGAGAIAGAAAGGVLGPVAEPLARIAAQPVQRAGLFGARQVGRAMSALGIDAGEAITQAAQPNNLARGIEKLSRRTNPEDMRRNAGLFRQAQIQPALADVIGDGERGLLRAMATRQTPARTAAREFADNRAVGLQDRMSVQARRHLSDDPRSPLQMREEIAARRSAEADQAFGAVRNELVQPEPQVIEALRAPATRSAIAEAATSALNRGDSETANRLALLVDGALDNPNGVQMTVGMADRISRSLNDRAEAFQRAGNNDSAGAYFSLAERLRGTARRQVPAYDDALNAYAADSRLSQATELGEAFMRMEPDEFAAAAARLAPEERQVALAAARRAVERQAGTPGQAPGVAQRLSGGREQLMRNSALMDDPSSFQRDVGLERQALMNARGINPMQGSPTSANMQDALDASGAMEAMGEVLTGDAPGLVRRIAASIKTHGFSDQEAEAVVMAALDPNQTDALIQMLSQRMPPVQAQRVIGAIRAQAASAAGATAGGPQ